MPPSKSLINKLLNEEFTIDSEIFGAERIGEVYPPDPSSDSVVVSSSPTSCPPTYYRTVIDRRDNPRQRRREGYEIIPVSAKNADPERGRPRSRIGRGRDGGTRED
jgi:hypothetical protein